MSRNLVLTSAILIFSAVCSFSQDDSLIITRGADFSYIRIYDVKYQGTVEKMKEVIEAENVKSVMFLNRDSLMLINEKDFPVSTSLKDIEEVSIKERNVSPALGIIPGVIAGGFIGTLIGAVLDHPQTPGRPFETRYTGVLIGALIGAVAGGFTGAEIINAINHETLDLHSVKDRDKKVKLIKFLRQK